MVLSRENHRDRYCSPPSIKHLCLVHGLTGLALARSRQTGVLQDCLTDAQHTQYLRVQHINVTLVATMSLFLDI